MEGCSWVGVGGESFPSAVQSCPTNPTWADCSDGLFFVSSGIEKPHHHHLHQKSLTFQPLFLQAACNTFCVEAEAEAVATEVFSTRTWKRNRFRLLTQASAFDLLSGT